MHVHGTETITEPPAGFPPDNIKPVAHHFISQIQMKFRNSDQEAHLQQITEIQCICHNGHCFKKTKDLEIMFLIHDAGQLFLWKKKVVEPVCVWTEIYFWLSMSHDQNHVSATWRFCCICLRLREKHFNSSLRTKCGGMRWDPPHTEQHSLWKCLRNTVCYPKMQRCLCLWCWESCIYDTFT